MKNQKWYQYNGLSHLGMKYTINSLPELLAIKMKTKIMIKYSQLNLKKNEQEIWLCTIWSQYTGSVCMSMRECVYVGILCVFV